MRVKCLAQEHNTMSPARARTWITRSGFERTNHEATAPADTAAKSFHFRVRSHEKLSFVCRVCVENEIIVMHVVHRLAARLARARFQRLTIVWHVFVLISDSKHCEN